METFNGEDEIDRVIRESFFPDRDYLGLMVEVGSAGPEYLSISKHFRESGWRVLAIEPNPEFCELHRKAGLEVLEFACSDEDADNVDFDVVYQPVDYGGGRVSYESFSSLGVLDAYRALNPEIIAKKIQVSVRRLDRILQESVPTVERVDVLSIDVEGWELSVLRGFSLESYKPKVVVIENLLDNPEYREYMIERGYRLHTTIHPNEIYVPKTDLDAAIAGEYLRILNKQPNEHEFAYWNETLGDGVGLSDLRKTLAASHDFAQISSHSDTVAVELDSFSLFCRSSDLDVGAAIISNREYQPLVGKMLRERLRLGHTFLDVGANIGYFSLLAAELVGLDGKVIACEPNASNLSLFYASILKNSIANTTVLPLAASDRSQVLRLQTFGSKGFLASPTGPHPSGQLVQAVALDDLLMLESRLDVIRIGVEGFEPLAISGMKKLIAKHRPLILTELWPWAIERRSGVTPQSYLNQLSSLGYTFEILSSGTTNTVARTPQDVWGRWEAMGDYRAQLEVLATPSPLRRTVPSLVKARVEQIVTKVRRR